MDTNIGTNGEGELPPDDETLGIPEADEPEDLGFLVDERPSSAPGLEEDTYHAAETSLVEVTFRQKRREYFTNPHHVPLEVGSFAVVEAERGEDMGIVTAIDGRGPRKRKGPLREVIRLATEEDLDSFEVNREKEADSRQVCMDRIVYLGLEMKLVDVEWQLDGNKITFYFTAAQRVDFRQLVKDLAGHFRTRIDLRQIGVRDEAKRLGGLGCCGREVCCSAWLTEFDPVTLKMARDQNLSLSPNKISGLCGRLMCCLGYEHDFYREAMRRFPRPGSRLTIGDQEYTVSGFNALRETVTVKSPEGVEKTITLLEVESPPPPADARRPAPEGNRAGRHGGGGGRRNNRSR